MADVIGTINYAHGPTDTAIMSLLGEVQLAKQTEIQRRASAVYGRERFYAGGEMRFFEPVKTNEQREALYGARRAVVAAYPIAYLRHRMTEMLRVIGFSGPTSWKPVYTSYVEFPTDAEGVQQQARSSRLQQLIAHWVTALASTRVFRPYWYLVLALVLLPVALVQRNRLAAILVASGVSLEAALFFMSFRLDFRANHWLIVSTMLGLVFVLHAHRERRRTHARAALAR